MLWLTTLLFMAILLLLASLLLLVALNAGDPAFVGVFAFAGVLAVADKPNVTLADIPDGVDDPAFVSILCWCWNPAD